MSAIFGIIDFEGRSIDPQWIKSMQTDLAHRGPDGQSLYQEESMFMGHMLLQVTPESIYDTSPYEEEGFVITANARLDEREAIMDRLNTPQSERDTITDPLLLLRSFLKFGKDFVKDIYGDFAFAIWDKEKRELFCARDQMGVKPFLYYFQENRFVFSTELKSIVKLPFVETVIDNLLLRDEAIGICDSPTKTAWKNIYRLQASRYLDVSNRGIITSKYWDLKIKHSAILKTEEEYAFALRELLEKVIADHSRVISEVGVPLSGGLDSSTIACVAARKFAIENKKIITASSVLDKSVPDLDINDELEYINEVLKQERNIDATYIYHSELEFLKNFNLRFDNNYAPVVHSHYVDEAIYAKFREKSVRRMLSGTLGDMTVSNSTVYPLPILLLKGKFKIYLKLSKRYRKNMKLSYFSHLRNNIIIPIIPFFLLQMLYTVFRKNKPWNIDNFPIYAIKKEKKVLQSRVKYFFKKYYLNQFNHINNIWTTNSENFGEDWDCGSSHHQIEITYPLLDRRIVEFLVQLPVEHFYMGGLNRGLIRKTMIGLLPEKIRLRRDKLPYSPAFEQINRKDIVKVLDLLIEQNLKKEMDTILDVKKMILFINKYVKPIKTNKFAPNYWEIIDMSVWICFNHWIINNKKLNSKRNEKTMD